MNLTPTLQGGIRLDMESTLDWARLEMIVIDAVNNDEDLALTLGSRMVMEEDWKDYVLPDLQHSFNEQLSYVNQEIKKARSGENKEGEIHITTENVDLWYGALNQARIALEALHQVSNYDSSDPEVVSLLSDEVRSSILKYHFYTLLQSHLLEHVMT